MAETELEVSPANNLNPTDQPTKTNPRESDAYKKHGRHVKTASLQMMEDAMVVEEALLKPLQFGKFIVKCPFLLCFIIFFIMFIVVVLDAQVFELSEQSNRTFLVEGDDYVESFDAYSLAGQFIADNSADNSSVEPQTQSDDWWIYQHMFTLKDYKDDFDINNPDKTNYWILTKDNVETIIEYENIIVEDEDWINQFCFVGPVPSLTNYDCSPSIVSAARWLYNSANYSDMTDEDIQNWIKNPPSSLLESLQLENFNFFFNPGLQETGQTYLYRSFIYAGQPIATEWEEVNGTVEKSTKYRNPLDQQTEQQREYIDWATPIFKDITVDNNGELEDGGLRILTVSWIVYNDYFNVLLNESMVYLVFAIMIVVIYMSIHLGSVFLAFCALFQILMSFPLAYFFYRIVFGIPHYDTLSSLIIFVLLGVGADDVFVFTDAWLQSTHFVRHIGGLDTVEEKDAGCWSNDAKSCTGCCVSKNETKRNIMRMSFAFRRAAKAMLVTQITTFCAFLATATSSIMPIAAFGIWAATIVAMNYVLVITLYPAILIVHQVYIKNYEQACLCCACRLFGRLCNSSNEEPQPTPATPDDDGDMMPQISRQLSEEEQAEEYRCFEQFLGTKWSKWIIKARYITLTFFIILFVGAAIIGSQMEAQSEDEKWFSDEHFMQKAQDQASAYSASETDNLVQIHITFGIKGVDRDGFSRWDPESYGEVVWDDDFSMSSPEAQSYLLKICEQTRNRSDLVYASRLVDCPIEAFKEYLENNSISTFPYDPSSSDPSFGEVYNDYLSSDFGKGARSNALTYVEVNGNNYNIRFYAMYIYTAITWTAASDESREFRGDWDTFIEDFSFDCPDNLCGSVRNTALRWCWLVTQQAFVRSAIQGILIAMPLAFIILIISTQNWIISIFAVFDIIGIMLCELSIMQLLGWKFGVSECVAIVIIIGFSVDYVVHLANAYLESQAPDRHGRLSFSLLTMGISVVSGAVTTFAAGFFLIFPDIVFFYKMGILMMSTVGISIFWAMCFFTSIVAAIGPEKDAGNLRKCFRCCPCCKDKEKEKARIAQQNAAKRDSRRDSYKNYTVNEGEFRGYELELEMIQENGTKEQQEYAQ